MGQAGSRMPLHVLVPTPILFSIFVNFPIRYKAGTPYKETYFVVFLNIFNFNQYFFGRYKCWGYCPKSCGLVVCNGIIQAFYLSNKQKYFILFDI